MTTTGSPTRRRPTPTFQQLLARYIAVAIVIILAALIAHYCGLEEPVSGRIVAVDGDTLKGGDKEFRLYGIDAPELRQSCTNAAGKAWACGRAAQAALRALIKGQTIHCDSRATDKFGRAVTTCSAGPTPDLNEAMVRQGFAVSFGPGKSQGPYADAEADARAAKRGIWQGSFDRPSDWRQAHPRDD